MLVWGGGALCVCGRGLGWGNKGLRVGGRGWWWVEAGNLAVSAPWCWRLGGGGGLHTYWCGCTCMCSYMFECVCCFWMGVLFLYACMFVKMCV